MHSPAGGSKRAFTIGVDGAGEKLVYGTHQPRQPSWSPDGQKIAFSFQSGSRDAESHGDDGKLYRNTVYYWRVAEVGADGGGFKELPTNSEQSFSPTWSADGKLVAFAGNEGLRLSAADGFFRELTHGAWHQSPAWSPDGSRIAFMVKQHDHFDIMCDQSQTHPRSSRSKE